MWVVSPGLEWVYSGTLLSVLLWVSFRHLKLLFSLLLADGGPLNWAIVHGGQKSIIYLYITMISEK